MAVQCQLRWRDPEVRVSRQTKQGDKLTRGSTKSDRFEHISRPAHTPINKKRELRRGKFETTFFAQVCHNFCQYLDSGAGEVQLSTTVIGKHYPGNTVIIGCEGILWPIKTLKALIKMLYEEIRWRLASQHCTPLRISGTDSVVIHHASWKRPPLEYILFVMLLNHAMSPQWSPGSMKV